MTWFKVDDSFWSHPKVLAVSSAAVGLWVRAGSYCAQHVTDGFLADSAGTLFGRDFDTLADELVEAGLWLKTDGGYQFHEWTEYQPSKESVVQKRAADRQRKAKARGKRTAVLADSAGTPNGVALESVLPDPTRPYISITSKEVIRSESADTDQKPKKPGNTPAPKPEPEVREDVKAVIEAFQASLDARDVKRGRVTKAWRDAARLMLDRDGRTVEQVQRCCQWLAQDPFWRKNILALPKLREQYDRLRLAAESERTPRKRLAVQDDEYAWLDARGGIAS